MKIFIFLFSEDPAYDLSADGTSSYPSETQAYSDGKDQGDEPGGFQNPTTAANSMGWGTFD
jgi:hypothetical protein